VKDKTTNKTADGNGLICEGIAALPLTDCDLIIADLKLQLADVTGMSGIRHR